MRIGYKAKRIIKAVALALAGVAAITAIAFGVKAIVDWCRNDLKEINPSFEVGSLGADGKYVADEGSLYTKEAFGCYGLQVKPDFDSTIDYQLYYYDILDNYISSSEVLSEGYSASAPVNGAYARVVITPRDDEDGKISFFEKVGYTSQLSIKVKKDQNIDGRFGVYKGKVLQVVYDTQSLVFTKGLWVDPESLGWAEWDAYCTTTTTLLKVKGGSTISFDFSSFGDSHEGIFVRVCEFKDLPLEDNILFDNFGVGRDESTFALQKDTKYLFISVKSGTASEPWDDGDLLVLPSCVSIK